MACVEGDRFIAVGVANRTPGAIGLSNVVVAAQQRLAAWTNLIGLAGRLFPGFPIVGYERDADLRDAESAGFRAIGPLRVWTCEP
ncbi:MAG: hypothetical protein HC937_01220 [Aquincola sp.]|nr:hypothetical protein [Aquincola sp.]